MKNKIISYILSFSVIFSGMVLPVSAKYTDMVTTTYQLTDESTLQNTFTGVAVGSSAWDSDDSISDYITLSQNKEITVTSAGSSAFVSLPQNITASDFEMSADVNITKLSTSNLKFTGFVFGANEQGYYQVLFYSKGTVRFSKVSPITSATAGEDIVDHINLTDITLDGSESASVKIKVEEGVLNVYVNSSTPVLTHPGYNSSGYFGFITSKEMKAVYSNFKIDTNTSTTVYEESDYLIQNCTASVNNQNISLSWKNPDVPGITSIKVTDEDDKEVTSYTGAINKIQAGENSIVIKNAEKNTEHKYKVTASFENHADTFVESNAVVIPFTEDDYKITDFDVNVLLSGARIVWKNPIAGGITSIEIKDSDGKVYAHDALTDAGAENTVNITGLGKGKSYTFTLTVNMSGKEPVQKSDTVFIPEGEETKYYPKNVVVHVKNEKLGLSWVNPEKNTLSGIKILNYETDEECEVEIFTDEELSLAGGVSNRIIVKGLSSEKPSKIRIVFEFNDGHKNVEYICEETASRTVSEHEQQNNTSYPDFGKVDEWQLFYNNQVSKYPQMAAKVYIDRTEKHDGVSSLKIVSNLKKDYGNTFYRIKQTISKYDPAKTYLVTMWVKYKNAKNSVLFSYDSLAMNSYKDGSDTSRSGWSATRITTKDNSDGWEKIEYIMEPVINEVTRRNEQEVRIQFSSGVEEFWVDDLSIVPIDSEQNVIGENIVKNGEFEVVDNTPCSRVSVNSDESFAKDGVAELKWKNPDDTALLGTVIYEEIDGELFECARLKNSSESIVFKNAVGDGTLKYVVKTLDGADNLSNPSVFELVPSYSDVIISGIEFNYEDSQIKELPENVNGNVKAEISVKNNKLSTFKGSLWVAIYENEVLKIVAASDEGTFTKGGNEVTLETYFNIPQKNGYRIEAFFVDNITNMKLLSSPAVLR